ncbi:IS3 family transposase [Alloiococcus sp. CFN-8]|uniref:IS3 family transposase n=1 Tax=Alloiococcus sp. CFN-8 TaxID=3416081 RepID=UPI003CF59843
MFIHLGSIIIHFFHLKINKYLIQKITSAKINRDYYNLRTKIKDAFNESSSRYEYRRIHSVIKSDGTTVSEKIVLRIMKEKNLSVLNIKRKKHSSHKGEISSEVENVIERDFHADKPNSK